MSGSVYDASAYWDLAFRDETPDELAFIDSLRHRIEADGESLARIYEPGCGGGRLVVALAAKGYDVSACDLSEPCVRYVGRRLRRRGLDAVVEVGDIRSWQPPSPVDLAFCPVNTFRHLTSEADALAHLRAVAAAVRPGGYYAIGLHLAPPDMDEDDAERWTATHGRTSVTVTLKVVAFSRPKRLERLRFNMLVRNPSDVQRFRTEFDYRLYTAAQLRSLLRKATEWEHISTHDFLWELDEPLALNDDLGDTVVLLRRR